MTNKKKIMTAALVCLPCASSFAYFSEEDYAAEAESGATYQLPAETSATRISSSLSAEVFYAESDLKYWGESTNMGGLGMRYAIAQISDSSSFQRLSPEFFFGGCVGYGYGEPDASSYREWDRYFEFVHLVGMMGANLRYKVGEHFSFYVGARMGLDYLYFYSDDGEDDTSGDDLGWIYGIGIGADISFSKNFAMTFGVEHLNSTAQPEVWSAKLPKQEYTMYSVGVKFMF